MPNGAVVPFGGVVTVPTSSVHLDIQRQVAQALQGVEENTTMAVLSIKTGTGYNLAVAHKFNKHFEVVTWIGKSGWQSPSLVDEGAISFQFSG